MLRRRLTAAASPMLVRAATTAASAVPGGGSMVSSLLKSTPYSAPYRLGFGISAATGSHLHLDLIGTGVFAVAAMSMSGGGDVRQRVSAGAIAIGRPNSRPSCSTAGLQTRHDGRLDGCPVDQQWRIWLLVHFLCVGSSSLPHAIAAGVPVAGRPTFGRMTDILGLALYAVGLTVESAADYQKWTFKADPANRGNSATQVWKISQHPNWFGNFCLWLGIWSSTHRPSSRAHLSHRMPAGFVGQWAGHWSPSSSSVCSTRRRPTRSRTRRSSPSSAMAQTPTLLGTSKVLACRSEPAVLGDFFDDLSARSLHTRDDG